MNLGDFFDIERVLFSPAIYYGGDLLLDGDYSLGSTDNILFLNALKIKGENQYRRFLKEEFYDKLKMIFNSNIGEVFNPKIVFSTDDTTKKRTVTFNYSTFVFEVISGLVLVDTKGYSSILFRFLDEVDETTSKEDLLIKMKEYLREEVRAYQDIQNNGTKSKYYSTARAFYEQHLPFMRQMRINMSFEGFIQNKMDTFVKLRVRGKDCLELFNKRINTEKLLKAFDFDTFCLLTAYSSILCCRSQEKSTGLVDNNVIYIKHYLDAVNKLRQHIHNYNPSIIWKDENGRKQRVYLSDIEKEYYDILARHPEFEFYSVDAAEIPNLLKRYNLSADNLEGFDPSSEAGGALVEKLYERIRLQKQLAASWEFLPAGKKEDNPEPHHHTTSVSLSEDEATRRMIIGRQFIESDSGVKYLYRLHGINTFAGYIGYIYPNGAVVFEKYYENEKTYRIARGSATYVMGIYNFLELSKLSKTEIIKRLKSDSSLRVKRIFHREDMEQWKSELRCAITGSDYTQEIIDYIESLTNNDLENNKTIKGE